MIVLYGLLIGLNPWLPQLAAVGSFLVFVMSFVTLSFLVTTPECWVPQLGDAQHGFPYLSGAGRLVLKDAIMMGAALVTMADSAKAYLHKRDTSLSQSNVAVPSARRYNSHPFAQKDAPVQSAIDRLRFAVRTLPDVLAGFSEAESEERPSPERWTKKEVVGHLIDSALNNHQRFVRGQLVGDQDFPRYDQDGWVRVQDYQGCRWADLIALWRAYNAHLLHVAERMTDEGRRATCRVGGGAEVTLEWLFVDYVDHLEHHLRAALGRWEVEGT